MPFIVRRDRPVMAHRAHDALQHSRPWSVIKRTYTTGGACAAISKALLQQQLPPLLAIARPETRRAHAAGLRDRVIQRRPCAPQPLQAASLSVTRL